MTPRKVDRRMSRVNLAEIPPGNAGQNRDAFELFSRDFLEALGFVIHEGPDRGPDAGRDLIVSEAVVGKVSELEVRWLVSVKHTSHSGKSVGINDEIDILGRVRDFEVDGFMAFYSMLPASGLSKRLQRVAEEVEVFVFDRGRIESQLLSNPALDNVFRQYLPESYEEIHRQANPPKLRLFTELGRSYPEDQKIGIEVATALKGAEEGFVCVLDSEMEDLMMACFIAQSLRESSFKILCRFVSFRPIVWRHLQILLEDSRIDGEALSREITLATDSTYLRLLITIAGAARLAPTAESICKKLLFEGRRHHSAIKCEPVPITPFFDVVKNTLGQMPASVAPTLRDYLVRAKGSKQWQEKRLLESALKRIGKSKRLRSR